jgi:mannose-6-phosphate isomerase
MNKIYPLENPVQEYAWGSSTAIAGLLGKGPTGTPQAELWMGAHPKAPSIVIRKGQRQSLVEMITRYPVGILGEYAAAAFDEKLPYLFKVLAAARPLSIQAHPDHAQAEAGFERENRLGIPLDAPHRNYRDPNHKPECICALTPFWALCGFRRVQEIGELLQALCPGALDAELASLARAPHPADGLRHIYNALMNLDERRRMQVIQEALSNVEKVAIPASCRQWILRLHQAYPSDIGILSPAILNLVCLNPGEALFLASGELHAYLEGLGMELMANSDNVLRGGLTPKHVDVPELLKVLRFEEKELQVLVPTPMGPFENRYPCEAKEFCLSVITLKGDAAYRSATSRSVEILFCTQGQAAVEGGGLEEPLAMAGGSSLLVPAAAPAYSLRGKATVYKAFVPVPP